MTTITESGILIQNNDLSFTYTTASTSTTIIWPVTINANVILMIGSDIIIQNINNYFNTIGSNITFNGANYTITFSNNASNNYNGLIYVANGYTNCLIENIVLSAPNCTQYSTPGLGSGWITKPYSGSCTIRFCTVAANINTLCGGIVAYGTVPGSTIVIENCSVVGTIGQNAGGIIGYGANGNFSVTNCYCIGNIESNAGSIMAASNGQTSVGQLSITNCYSVGAIDAAGGIIGGNCNISTLTMTNTYHVGDMINAGGGLIGNNNSFNQIYMINCYHLGSLLNGGGGLIGNNNRISQLLYIINCYCIANIDLTGSGLINYATGSSTCAAYIINSYYMGNIAAGDSAYINTGTTFAQLLMQNCYNIGQNYNLSPALNTTNYPSIATINATNIYSNNTWTDASANTTNLTTLYDFALDPNLNGTNSTNLLPIIMPPVGSSNNQPNFTQNYPSNPLPTVFVSNNNQWIQSSTNTPWLLTAFNNATISANNSPNYQYLYTNSTALVQIQYSNTTSTTTYTNYVLTDTAQYVNNTINTTASTILEASGNYTIALPPSTSGTYYYYMIAYNTITNLANQYSYLTYTIPLNPDEGEGEGEYEAEGEGEFSAEPNNGNTYDTSTPTYSLADLTTDPVFNSIPAQYSINTIGIDNIPLCFKIDTKILCLENNAEIYIPIQNITPTTLVKTINHGYLSVAIIGKSLFHNSNNNQRTVGKLYKYPVGSYPEIIEDLYITGGHSILVDSLTTSQQTQTIKIWNMLHMTDNKYHLLACVDDKAEPCIDNNKCEIWHLALNHPAEMIVDRLADYRIYGIYANGLLVESCSKHFLAKQMSLV